MLARRLGFLLPLAVVAACVSNTSTPPSEDAGGLPGEDASLPDASLPDTSVADSSAHDSSVNDTSVDTAVADTAPGDSSPVDVSSQDAPVDSPAADGAGPDSSPDAPTGDASIEDSAAPDAASPDAGAPDASEDAGVDAGPPPVSVTVQMGGVPEPGIVVVFEDSSGNVTTSLTTDVSGRASAVVVAGSQVTALLGTPSNPAPTTITSVSPGDELVLNDIDNASATVSINALPAPLEDAGPGQYSVYAGPCNTTIGDPLPGQLTLSPGCFTNGAYPLLITGANFTGFVFQENNPLPTDGGTAQISIATPWLQNVFSQTVQVANLGGNQANVSLVEVAEGLAAPNVTTATAPLDGGPASATLVTHGGYPDYVQAEANEVNGEIGGGSFTGVAQAFPAPSSSMTFSLDYSAALSAVAAATVDPTNVAQPVLGWSMTSGLPLATNGFVAAMSWTSTGDAGTVSGTWTIVGPPNATTVQAPQLPAGSAWTPAAGSNFNNVPVLLILDGSFMSGYQGLRSNVGSFIPLPQGGWGNQNQAVAPIIPQGGVLSFATFGVMPS
jgi:hypothetical protein